MTSRAQPVAVHRALHLREKSRACVFLLSSCIPEFLMCNCEVMSKCASLCPQANITIQLVSIMIKPAPRVQLFVQIKASFCIEDFEMLLLIYTG